MPSFILTILELSAALTASSLCAFALRRAFLRGRERETSIVWLCIFMISLLPVRVGTPLFYLFPETAGESVSAREAEYSDALRGAVTVDVSFGQPATYSADDEYPEPLDAPSEGAAEISVIVFAALTALWALGATLCFARSIIAAYGVRQTLECCSRDPGDADRALADVFEHCKKLTGVKRARLRIYGDGFDCSPCVVGTLRPTVYIGADAAEHGLIECGCILSHELLHVKNGDEAAKLFITVAAAIHWFNPSARRVADAYAEDCEYRADAGVLRLFGEAARAPYMNAILDAAERMSCPPFTAAAIAGGGVVSAISLDRLERRYENMKHIKPNTFIKAGLAAFIAVSFCMSAFLLSSCAVASAADSEPTDAVLSPCVEDAIRAYYKIGYDSIITNDMIEGVTSLYIGINTSSESVAPEGETLVDVFVNDSIYGGALECVVGKERFESLITLMSDDEGSAAMGKTLSSASAREYIGAFYTLKDPSDASLDEAGVAEMYAIYPATRDGAIYLLDPETKPREAQKLFDLLFINGLLDDKLIDSGELDAACFAELPNLKSVTVSGVTLVNEPETRGYSVTVDPERQVTGKVYDAIDNQALKSELLFREITAADVDTNAAETTVVIPDRYSAGYIFELTGEARHDYAANAAIQCYENITSKGGAAVDAVEAANEAYKAALAEYDKVAAVMP